jgi:hypothetical protein
MSRSDTYRRPADECLRWADQTLDANDRDALLRMADQWHQLAEQEAARLSTIVERATRQEPPIVSLG